MESNQPSIANGLATTEAITRLHRAYGSELFPLPLSPLEQFLWWDDTEAHPLCNFIELRFDGAIEQAAMERAFQLAAHLHPLLICRIVSLDGKLYWQPDVAARPRLYDSQELKVTDEGKIRRIDLTQEIGVVGWHARQVEGDRLLFAFHHTCCDGNGFRRFLLDMLSIYVHLRQLAGTVDSADELIPTHMLKRWRPQLLQERFDFSKCWSEQPRMPISTWQRIKNAHYFHFQPPEALGKIEVPGADASSIANVMYSWPPVFLQRVLDREKTSRLLERCRADGVGVNEACLAALFKTCSMWHRLGRGGRDGRRLRLLMPFAMMSRADLRMPAANRLSFAFLGRTEADCDDWNALLVSIRQEVRETRDMRLPMDFLLGLQAASRWPGLMKWGIARSQNMCTAVLSFGGGIARGRGHQLRVDDGVLDVVDCKLQHVFGAPPVRINTNIAIGVCLSGGSLCIAEAWSRQGLDETQAEAFLDLFVNVLDRWGDLA